MIFPLLTAIIAVLFVSLIWLKTVKPKNFPPGPTGLPIIGSILSMGSMPHLTILKWAKKYGDIFSFYDGTRRIVILSDFHTVRKVFGDEAATGRITGTIARREGSALPVRNGLASSQGALWKTHRRFALSALRDLGMGKNWLEDSIGEEVAGLLQVLKNTKKQPFNPKITLTNCISNVICALAFGKRFPVDDPKFSRLTGFITDHVASIKIDFLAQAFPFLMWFPNPVRTKLAKIRQNHTALALFLKGIIAQHQKANRDAEVEDYVHAYQKEGEIGSKTGLKETFDDQQLIGSLFDLFVAGTETTSTTTLWAMVFMTEHPDIMKKVQDEIDRTVGRERMLTNDDRALLPYTEAVILEVQRAASLVPLAVPHVTLEQMTIDGYTIPKGTMIAANLFSIHRDPRYWTNPLEFIPERFLDENSRLLKPDGFAPFSIGKRVCLGEALAKMELFLFIANLLRAFTLELPPGKTLSHEDYYASLANSPNPFKLIFVPRT